jgi:phosphoribosylformylglycinamidine synthase
MSKIYRVYIEKKEGFDAEASNLYRDIVEFLEISNLKKLRMLYRYDVQGIDENAYKMAKETIFSDPPQDIIYDDEFPFENSDFIFAVEYLPGQYDQRADSAAQCIQILTQKEAPLTRTAKIIILSGSLSGNEIEAVKKFCINPVDSREAILEKPQTLEQHVKKPQPVKTLTGFIHFNDDQLKHMLSELGLAMNMADLKHCQSYFKKDEQRDPTITELKLLDTYWSDHCRHTTFLTVIDSVEIEKGPYSQAIEMTYNQYLAARDFVYQGKDREDCLMDLATIAMKELRKKGMLKELDVSEEINACSIKIPVHHNGSSEDWLIMFKNETHNHPTEIEPFGGAATCLGGAIRDPLSGRAYVYQAMRVTGCGDPRTDITHTLPGKLPQRTITTTAAKGYCSYGNQIGLATGMVSEIYDEGYVAKRMEIGAVVGAVPAANVKRENPRPGDIVMLIGGRTGRDGIGGATGSSKAHTHEALKNEAEVQKGNPPIERKLQRLFTDKTVINRIKRCNDFGAGGVSVAIGELTDSLMIDLNKVPKKYEGLDGTELALSESQERMAVVIAAEDLEFFISKAFSENLEATKVAEVTATGRLQMVWNEQIIVNLKRSFLDTSGVRQNTTVKIAPIVADNPEKASFKNTDIKQKWLENLSLLNVANQQGLIEQFDSTIGARNVLHPFGGRLKRTPTDVMVSKLPFIESDMVTVMSWGFDPVVSKWSPYHAAVYSVLDSVAKIVAAGANYQDVYLTFQEYYERLNQQPEKWGKPYAALLGAYHAQSSLQIAAIGGKDSMSGTFQDIHVPPTLVSFAIATHQASATLSPEFKQAGNRVVLIKIPQTADRLPDFYETKKIYKTIFNLNQQGGIKAASVIKQGGVAASVSKMCFGNNLGFKFEAKLNVDFFNPDYGSLILEIAADVSVPHMIILGHVCDDPNIYLDTTTIPLEEAFKAWDKPLRKIFPKEHNENVAEFKSNLKKPVKVSINLGVKPRVFIPVFPGTNCEFDSAQAFNKAGAQTETAIFNNLTAQAVNDSLKTFVKHINQSQILMIPGGFSAGDEPEGSGKFIATVFRNPTIADAVMDLLKVRDGLILGVCNGFQALIKLGLVPFGEIRNADSNESPTLTFNKLKRHYSCMVHTKMASGLSPWLMQAHPDEIYTIPVSNGEGRIVANNRVLNELFSKGQVAFQYVDLDGKPSMSSQFNPPGSMAAIESLTSPDGRVLGKMAHSERIGINVSKNIPGNHDQKIFESGVSYFK